MNDNEIKATALCGLALNYGKEMPDILFKMWLKMLGKYTGTEVEKAVLIVMQSHKYANLPPFSVLQNALDAVTGRVKISVTDLATAEWGVLTTAIRKKGRYNEPEFRPETAYALRLMGGWQVACSWKTDSLPFIKKEFLGLWEQCQDKVELMQGGADMLLSIKRRDENISPIIQAIGSEHELLN